MRDLLIKLGNDLNLDVTRLLDTLPKSANTLETLKLHVCDQMAQEPDFNTIAAQLTLAEIKHDQEEAMNSTSFADYIQHAVGTLNYLSADLLDYDLHALTLKLRPERDKQFTYLGIQTLSDRYFIRDTDGLVLESPQFFFMRVAMGLAINEENRNTRAVEFYNLLSSFDFMCSTPTLFNAGTTKPQLSSCYITTVPDDLVGIFDNFTTNAKMSKYAGGIANDWTPVRGLNAPIKGTRGISQGVIPFLNVASATTHTVNQGGKRKGSACAYLATYHIDVEDFLDCRKNTGDDRRRTHDMNTANWIPDLFMYRVLTDSDWTLFSPDDVPDLHDLYGDAFNKRYAEYEEQTREGTLKLFQTVKAVDLWQKMLSALYTTGHPWITFKDPCNIRSPQSHCGVVHSSNLCTEIVLNTSKIEQAVCNLGSVNLANHITAEGLLDECKLSATIKTAMRMLDNVIDVNLYPTNETRYSNLRNRPVGLGIMGVQDALYKKGIPYASQEALDFADSSTEAVCYFAILESSNLASERGSYTTFKGSTWSRGLMPLDTLKSLRRQREAFANDSIKPINPDQVIDVNTRSYYDWDGLAEIVQEQGMRNSNTTAIAPTATISNICGVTQSIEPTYQNLYVKSNLSGDFVTFNPYLVDYLKKQGLWSDAMVTELKARDGSIQHLDLPQDVKDLFQTAFEIDSDWLIDAASLRQKWVDQSHSLNLYMHTPSGKKLKQMYTRAWVKGLKTTYYLRSLAATSVEKVSVDDGDHNSPVCSILDPDCEACQ